MNTQLPTHLRETVENNNNLITPQYNNNIISATNPNVSFTISNRTFGGTSSASYSSQVYGVKGSSRGLGTAGFLNKAELQYDKPQRSLALPRGNIPTYNKSNSTVPNGYFIRNVNYGEQLDSNVSGPQQEPVPSGVQTVPLVNPNSVYAQKVFRVG
jgi:hypothetical protein